MLLHHRSSRESYQNSHLLGCYYKIFKAKHSNILLKYESAVNYHLILIGATVQINPTSIYSLNDRTGSDLWIKMWIFIDGPSLQSFLNVGRVPITETIHRIVNFLDIWERPNTLPIHNTNWSTKSFSQPLFLFIGKHALLL